MSTNCDYDAVTRSWLAQAWGKSPNLNPANFFAPQIAPLPIWIMGTALRFWPDIWLVPRLAAFIFGCAALFPLYFLSRRVFGEPAAAWTCLLGAFYSLQIKSSVIASSEAIFCFLLLWAIYFIFNYRQTHEGKHLAGAILFINLACVSRYNGLIYWALLGILILKPKQWKATLKPAILFWLLGALLPTGWFWLNWRYLGQGLYPLRFILGEHLRVSAGLQGTLTDRLYNLLFLPGVIMLSLSPLVIIFGIKGIGISWRQRDAFALLLLMAAPIAYYIYKSVIAANFFLLARFATDPALLWLPFAGLGLKAWQESKGISYWGIAITMAVWLGLVAVLGEADLPVISPKLESISPISHMSRGQQAIANYIDRHVKPEELILLDHNPFWQELEIIFYSRHPKDGFLRINEMGKENKGSLKRIKWVVSMPKGFINADSGIFEEMLNRQGFRILRFANPYQTKQQAVADETDQSDPPKPGGQ